MTSTGRAEVRAWIAANWDPALPLREWRRRLLESGWAAPSWPVDCFGRGLAPSADAVVGEELAAAGAPGPPLGAGMGLAAPTLLAHASTELKQTLLPPIVTGEATWCQLFSEPGSGSDLAGLTTRAERDGDEWVVNGQKVWSTSAHHARYGMLLARTDWDVPKHNGITYFVLPMDQPGVEARPLRQMNGHASFNEVFLTDARVPAANVVGEPGGGWRVALTTLAHERGFATMRRRAVDRDDGRALAEAAAEAEDFYATYSWYPQRAGRADLVGDVAALVGRRGDSIARQRIAAVAAQRRAHEWTARRAQAARAAGRAPGAEGSLGKLAASTVARRAADAHSLLSGAAGQLTGDDGLLDGIIAEVLLSVPAQSIAGGTDEIQRNIIGERVLGLPKEPSVDRDVPFRDVPRNPARGSGGRPP
jgi:alkylation response protein AidB-like acyl-CoA dehydrogenase